jgi:hypothetical protein
LAKNEEGEFELVLGNRQLISVFLIVVILLAVFFSMGYIVGRNSAPGATVESAQNSKPSAPEAAQKESPSPSPPAASQESPVAPADDAHTTTQPEKPAPARKERAPAPAVKESKPDPAGARVPAEERASASGEPAPGQYWQVVAAARPDAEIIAEALTKKGFHAVVAPGPREGVFRVVVGPLKDAAAQAQTRTGLEAAGFKNPLMRKY